MTFLISSFTLMFLSQLVLGPTDFTRIIGNSLQVRYDSALVEGTRGTADRFWVGYQVPVRAGLRFVLNDGGVSFGSVRINDGIEFQSTIRDATRVGVFLLIRKADGIIEKTRLLDLDENFKIHDRQVYWIGEPAADESVMLLTKLVDTARETSSLLMTIGLHPDPYAADTLLRVARTAASTNTRKNAIFWLGQQVSRQAGEELEKMANADPDIEIQKQVVFALSQRKNDESIPVLTRIAKEHSNLAVRRQAIFWLSQKKDPRVVDLFEQMLKK
jgi:hypothetical protein